MLIFSKNAGRSARGAAVIPVAASLSGWCASWSMANAATNSAPMKDATARRERRVRICSKVLGGRSYNCEAPSSGRRSGHGLVSFVQHQFTEHACEGAFSRIRTRCHHMMGVCGHLMGRL
eukprot:scaffold12205_cov33-Tisochrysis_lutea.AAC.2